MADMSASDGLDGLRIVSDGTAEGTHVYLDDAEIHEITNVTWNFSPSQRKTFVTLEISNVMLDTRTVASPETRAALQAMTGPGVR